MHGDPHEIPKARWSVQVLDIIAESEHVCDALFKLFEHISFRLFLLIFLCSIWCITSGTEMAEHHV